MGYLKIQKNINISVDPDRPSQGKKSDHAVPVIYPLNNHTIRENTEYKKKTTRPLPDSGVRRFGQLMLAQDWEEVRSEDSPSEQDEALQAVLARMLEDALPLKTVRLRYTDKPYITKEIKTIDRRRRREYDKNLKSQKYLNLTNIYRRKFNIEAQKYLNKNVRALIESEPGRAYSILKRLGSRPGETDSGCFELPEHISLRLTAAESADRIAQKFSEISQEYPALDISTLPTRVYQNIVKSKSVQKPIITQKMVEQKIRLAKNTRGGVPGDLPIKLAKEFGPELAVPATIIFNKIVQTGKWPTRWKEERGIPLNKVKPNQPKDEGELRIIFLTPFLSKTFERIVLDWLLEYVDKHIDWSQFGGRKGSSCNHYIIDMITFILYNQDLKEPKAVLAAMVDFEKAFNRQNHHKLITKLHEMGVPGWLLNITIGF